MKFSAVPIDKAEGKILGHNIAGPDGRRAFRKGKPLTAEDLDKLRQIGRQSVYVAELDAHDIDENTAALRIAEAARGAHVTLSKPTTGRANLLSTIRGILRVDTERLLQVNLCESVTLATMPNNSFVRPNKMVATLKVIAYAIPQNVVREAEYISQYALNGPKTTTAPIIAVDPLPERRVGMILSGSPAAKGKIVSGFEKSLRARLETWGSQLEIIDFVPQEDERSITAVADVINRQIDSGMEMIILAGETAIMDRHDIAPLAVEAAGGRITCFGAPVDPGNLLMLARHDANGHAVQIVGTPGCARSPKRNIVDLVLPRLLVGDYLTKMDIVRMGHGGMLDDVPERPRPRRLN